ncbi:MAG: hypothetical protein EOO14_08980, partial [Chitinophagaceae bacterium]
SSVNAICTTDINGDGKTDLLLGGNLFGFPPQFGQLDASYGDVLLNTGDGTFSWIPNRQAGISIRGAIKDIKLLQQATGKGFLFLQNNEKPLLYKMNQ